ncbi:hypothetical protein [Prochlorococcus sp. MIT 1307]|uniref:hypothetical protein n=1 Tax=Prochlorococcus sp. MIT 1307 TaxID=3096219 RepID=UPI002A75261F|nr:hypothetical protein [Prochlorococcus sp. MIT 1307]
MNILPLLLSLIITITPSSSFDCDGELLTVTIRNNLNGDFALTTDLEKIDQGAFVVLDWKNISLMLPVSFQKGEISFTDRKWLWSYQDNEQGLHEDNPRFAQRIPSGEIIEHECKLHKAETV